MYPHFTYAPRDVYAMAEVELTPDWQPNLSSHAALITSLKTASRIVGSCIVSEADGSNGWVKLALSPRPDRRLSSVGDVDVLVALEGQLDLIACRLLLSPEAFDPALVGVQAIEVIVRQCTLAANELVASLQVLIAD